MNLDKLNKFFVAAGSSEHGENVRETAVRALLREIEAHKIDVRDLELHARQPTNGVAPGAGKSETEVVRELRAIIRKQQKTVTSLEMENEQQSAQLERLEKRAAKLGELLRAAQQQRADALGKLKVFGQIERDNDSDEWRDRIIEFIAADGSDAYTSVALLTAIGIKKQDRNAYLALTAIMGSLGWYSSQVMGSNGRRVRGWRRAPY